MRKFTFYLLSLLILTLAASIGTKLYYHSPYPGLPGPELDPKIKQSYKPQLESQKPGLLLLGDSTMIYGVDDILLSQLTGEEVYSIGWQGSGSAIWYLIIKSNIATASYHPPYLVIFFRDTMLTEPDFRVNGRYLEFVDNFASTDDALLMNLAYTNQMSLVEKAAETYLPFYDQRLRLLESFERLLKYTLVARLFGVDQGSIDQAMDSAFDQEDLFNISVMNESEFITAHYDFQAQLTKSFLPEIIRLCQENQIQLILVRVKTQTSTANPEALENYLESLQAYLLENNVILLDFAEDDRLTAGLFFDSIHLNEEGKLVFTHILAEGLSPIVEQQSP